MSYYGLSIGMVLLSIPGDFAQPNIFSPADENGSWWGVPDIEHQKNARNHTQWDNCCISCCYLERGAYALYQASTVGQGC